MVEANNVGGAEDMKAPQDMQFSTPDQQNLDAGMAMSGGHQGGPPQKPYVPMNSMKMKGLPFTVTREEILNFFANTNLINDSVKIGVLQDGRLTGEAVCLFQSDGDCQAAHEKLDQKHIGSRWVKLIRIQMDEYDNFE